MKFQTQSMDEYERNVGTFGPFSSVDLVSVVKFVAYRGRVLCTTFLNHLRC